MIFFFTNQNNVVYKHWNEVSIQLVDNKKNNITCTTQIQRQLNFVRSHLKECDKEV